MSETSVELSSGLVDEAAKRISSDDAVEPVLRYVQEHPVCTALAAARDRISVGQNAVTKDREFTLMRIVSTVTVLLC
jgi:hypothetical protein